jgi:hypothetical protein
MPMVAMWREDLALELIFRETHLAEKNKKVSNIFVVMFCK